MALLSLWPRVLLAACLMPLNACSGDSPPSVVIGVGAPSVDQAVPVSGAPDHGDDPAVVALDLGGQRLCSGALIAADVVITARHCVSVLVGSIECPTKKPQVSQSAPAHSIRVLVGDDLSSAVERARGRGLVLPPADSFCEADIALVLLDEPIDDVQALTVRPTGAANGDHVRSVSFGRVPSTGATATKLILDHVPVIGTTPTELLVGEAPCEEGGCGGPTLDETSGEIVGVASRSVSSDSGASNAYMRTDAFLDLVDHALTASMFPAATGAGVLKAKKGSPDMGANCSRGVNCASGACVSVGAQRYCSRSCGTHDACPAHFRCEPSQQGEAVCVEK
jgi:hypothetical protein